MPESVVADDSDAVVSLIQRIYSTSTRGLRLTGDAGRAPRFEHRVLGREHLSVTDIACDGRLEFATLPADGVVLPAVVWGGRVEFAGRFGHQHLSGGDVGLVPADGPYTCIHNASTMSAAVLDHGQLAEYAADTYDIDPRAFQFYSAQPLSRAAGVLWREVFDTAHHLLSRADEWTFDVAEQGRRLLHAATLNAFPNTALEAALDPLGRGHDDAGSGAVRRAMAFIDSHPADALTVADIARAARVSVRSLQSAFRRELDTTPLAHLRRVRLDRAHRELLAATFGDGTTVTGIAARWGFTRPSRFAAEYRAAYWVHPHQTLRRDPP